MLLNELFDDGDDCFLTEGVKRVWSRKGNSIVRKFRCTSGKKKGRLVASPSECGAPVDLQKRRRMKKLLVAYGNRLRRKAQRTKRVNPTSKRIQKMNKNDKKL